MMEAQQCNHPFKNMLIKEFLFKDFPSIRRKFNKWHEDHQEVESVKYPSTQYDDLFTRVEIRLHPATDQKVGDTFVVFTTESYKGYDKVIGIEHVVTPQCIDARFP